MAIFRGVGGSGDSSDNSFLQEVTAQANAASASATDASASATDAANSATSALNTELTSASFNTSDGVLTLTKQDGDTVTADLDGRFLTSHQDITGKADLSGATFTGDISFGDNVKAKFGDADDLLIYHSTTSGNKSVIEDAGAGGLHLVTNGPSVTLKTNTGDTMLTASKDSGVILNYDNYIKLQTTVDGITVWDDAQFDDNINVDGNITVSGTVDGVDIAARDNLLSSVRTTANNALPTEGGQMTGDVLFNDGVKAKFGTDSDLAIYHTDGGNSVIEETGEGALVLQTNGSAFAVISDENEYLINATVDGGVTLYHDNNLRLSTSNSSVAVSDANFTVDTNTLYVDEGDDRVGINTSMPAEALDVDGNIAVSGSITGATFSDAVSFGDDIKLKFGDGDDLLIYHNTTGATESIIEDVGQGGLHLKSNGNGVFLKSDTQNIIAAYIPSGYDSYASLFYGNSERLKTISGGVDVTGDITVSGTVDGRDVATDGAKLDNIEASADVTDTANVTSAGAAMLASSPTFTGTITAPNVDISTTGTVTTNIASGGATSGVASTKTVNIGTGFSTFWGGLTTINIGTQSATNINEVNIGSGAQSGYEDTINLKGDVTVDGTLAGLSYNYVIPLFQGYTNLTTSATQIGNDFYLRNYNSKPYKRFVEVTAAMGYTGTTSTNDLNLRVIMVVPTSSGSAVDIGSVVSITTTSIYGRDIVVAGDVTHWFSDYAGVGANSNGLAAFTAVTSAVYNPTTDQTTFNAGVYGSTLPSVGDSIYVHPFDWESSGTEIYGHIKQFDVDAEATMSYQIYTKVYLGNIDRITTCRLKFHEAASSDSINIQRLQAYQTDESA